MKTEQDWESYHESEDQEIVKKIKKFKGLNKLKCIWIKMEVLLWTGFVFVI